MRVDALLGLAPVLHRERCLRYGFTPGWCADVPLDTSGAANMGRPCRAPQR